jgi:predicted AAA+ superfamily ATPase
MNYYIVRAIWGNDDMSEEFIKNNYWENGYDDKFVDLINNIKIPSIFVLAGKDNTVINIGKCLENYKNGKKLNIEWNQNFDKFKIDNLGKYQKTIQQIQNKDIEEKIKNYMDNKKERIIKNMKTKNIMLYGAPGVGKTHNYKRLITMIEDGNDEKTIFDTISKNETTNDFDNSIFEDIKKEKRIEFVTFHQSYSYEDFIEGFRPSENSHIELEDGIFKLLCNMEW